MRQRAWHLSDEGVAVTMLERATVGMEASWAAAGMIAPQGEADEAGAFFAHCMEGKRAFDRCVERLICAGDDGVAAVGHCARRRRRLRGVQDRLEQRRLLHRLGDVSITAGTPSLNDRLRERRRS